MAEIRKVVSSDSIVFDEDPIQQTVAPRVVGFENLANRSEVQAQAANWCGAADGTVDDIVLTVTPELTGYVAGQTFRFISAGANAGPVTIEVSEQGVKALLKNSGDALIAGDILEESVIEVIYDGTQFKLRDQLTIATLASGSGAGGVGLQRASEGAATTTVEAKLREWVSMSDYVGGTPDSPDVFPAYLNAKADVGTRTIFFDGDHTTIYNMASYPNEAEQLVGPMFDVAPGVTIRIPQADGLDATYGNTNIRVVRTTLFHQSEKDVYFYVSPQNKIHVQDRLIWPSIADADHSKNYEVDCTVEPVAKKFNWDLEGDAFVLDDFSSTTASSVVCNTAQDGFAHMAMLPIRVGESLSAAFSDFHNAATTLYVVIRCASGYYGVSGTNSTGSLTKFSKEVGDDRVAEVFSPETFQHESYIPLSSGMSIKIRDIRHAAICLNGSSILDIETESDIIEAGFGNYTGTPGGAPLTIRDIVRTKHAPVVHGHTSVSSAVFGDSNSADGAIQHVLAGWPTLMKTYFDAVAGVRIKTIGNFAVPGATAASQKPLCTALNIAFANYVFFDLGTNDIQQQTPLATYLADMAEMIDLCLSEGKRVIVALPPMFYSQANASGRGNLTTFANFGSLYRSGLARLCAVKKVKLVDCLGGFGPVIADYLDTSVFLDSTVYDNVHLSMFARMNKARLMGNALMADLASCTETANFNVELPSEVLTVAAVGFSVPGHYHVDHAKGDIRIFGKVQVEPALADDTIVANLPEVMWPVRPLEFVTHGPGFSVVGIKISTTGAVRIYNAPVGGGDISIQISYNKF